MPSFRDRLSHAWNAFAGTEIVDNYIPDIGFGSSTTVNPGRVRMRFNGGERSIIASIYTRMSIDISSIPMRHTRHDDQDRYVEDVDDGLNDCLTVQANIDQGAQAFRQDIVLTLFNKGVAAIVPVDTTLDPSVSGSWDVQSLRVGEVVQWYPYHVRLSVYNEKKGRRQEIVLPKAQVGIVENPFYGVMNEPNSTLQRLTRKLALLDTVDEAAGSGKLDLIIQLPYVIKSESRREQANQRRADIEYQLTGSKYGVAYTDGTEKITQLNRPVENNLLAQIEYLTNILYSELGLTPEVMNGTAIEAVMLNYLNRTIEPILQVIVEELRRKFLTKTARTQGQSVDYFRDVFKLMPLADVAEVSDKLTRNEIATSNEIRQAFGWRPSKDPKADMLINSNMPVADTGVNTGGNSNSDSGPPTLDQSSGSGTPADTGVMSQSFDQIDKAIDGAFSSLGLDTEDAAT